MHQHASFPHQNQMALASAALNLVSLFILRKIIKFVATRYHIFRLKCTKFDLGWGSTQTLLGELKRSPRSLAGLRDPTSKGREGKGREGEGRTNPTKKKPVYGPDYQTVCVVFVIFLLRCQRSIASELLYVNN